MRTVLITGASSGIGKAFAYRFAKEGYRLVLVARREELLKQISEDIEKKHGMKVLYFPCDIAADPKEVYDVCKENDIQIDILVNNAGYGDYGRFIDGDIDKLQGMIDLNCRSLTALAYYFIKDMKNNGYGHIINVASVASFMPGPNMAVYYATKAYVMSFSLALREELKKDNVHVSVLCPAPTKSPFWDVAGGTTSAAYDNVFARMPEDAAETGYKAYKKDKAYMIDGLSYKILISIVRHMPLEMAAKAIGYIQSKTKDKKGA